MCVDFECTVFKIYMTIADISDIVLRSPQSTIIEATSQANWVTSSFEHDTSFVSKEPLDAAEGEYHIRLNT